MKKENTLKSKQARDAVEDGIHINIFLFLFYKQVAENIYTYIKEK